MKQLALYFQANRLEKKAQWQQAAAIYKKIASVAKDNSGRLAYRQGMMAEKLKDWPNAQQFFSQAVAKRPHDANCFYHLGLAYEYDKKYQQAAKALEKSLAIKPNNPYALRHLGKVLIYGGDPAEGEGKLYQAIALRPDIDIFWQDLITAIRRQGRTWQEVEILQKRIEQQGQSAQLYFELGEAQDKMNRFVEAAQAFAQANVIRPGDAMWHFREGYAWEHANEAEKAQAAYTTAIAADQDLQAQSLGVGVFHQQRGYWPQAAEAYTKAAAADPTNAELQYRLGLAHDRCYRWEQATRCYRQALALDTTQADWHYRLGFVLERQGLLEQAAQAYEYAATTRERHTSYWFYRLGHVLAQAGKYEQACSAFLNTRTQASLDALPMLHAQTALSLDYQEKLKASVQAAIPQAQRAALHSDNPAAAFYKLGNQAERLQMWEEAAQAYRDAVARSNNHNGSWYYRLGYVLMQMGRMEQAADAFVETRIFKQPHGVDERRYKKDSNLIQVMEYTEHLETLPVAPEMVMYESYAGVSISCNPYAIYKAIVDSPKFAGWTHIWVLNDPSRAPEECIGRSNVIFVARNSQLYMRYLTTAKWLINNSTFPSYFIRRDEQRYLNTWHGTPLKTLGKDIRGNFMEHKNTARNLLHATHIISPNSHTSHVLIERNDIEGLYRGQLAQTGYPRNDLVINATNQQKTQFRKKLGLPATNKPLVLYAPTWRGILGHPEIDSHQLISDLRYLQQQDCQILFRGHYFAEKVLEEAGLENVYIAPQAVDTSELLAITDVLITDYSSIFFDFLLTKRPILFYSYDQEQYEKERGLYFSMQEMPGKICHTLDILCDALANILVQITNDSWSPDKKYLNACTVFSPREDGGATDRVIDFFFNYPQQELQSTESTRKTLLFFAGPFTPNGITTAALNLISIIDPDRYRVVVAIDSVEVAKNSARLERLKCLPEHVQIISRVGRQNCSPQEKKFIDDLHRGYSLEPTQWIFYDNAYQTEFKRMFGAWQPDYVINYDGYARYWAGLFAFGPSSKIRRIIYLHNDMFNEWQLRFPYLISIFSLYSRYDLLVSVAKMISLNNQKNLAERLSIPSDKFVFVDNMPDFNGILTKADMTLDANLFKWIEKVPERQFFISIGRFSPEKNHELMLDAFAQVLQSYPQAKLIILGDGPLRKRMEEQIERLRIGCSVMLPGILLNPFPLLTRSDCFILSSRHEGQPMVLLEAMVLNKPIIATNIPGVRELLEPGYGKLVGLNVDEMSTAMKNFCAQKEQIEFLKLDSKRYKDNVLEQFEQLLV